MRCELSTAGNRNAMQNFRKLFMTANFDTETRSAQIVQTSPGNWQVFAPAKINLNLLVGPLRKDGFHPVDSVVSKISLYDTLQICEQSGQGDIDFSCAGFDAGPDSDNLVVRACKIGNSLAANQGIEPVSLRISLAKNIPTGAGLGGGSSDAAAILSWYKMRYNLQISDADLFAHAAILGSDVPLFLAGVSSRMTGRGEIIAPVTLADFFILLFMPELHCPTGPVYKQYDSNPREITDAPTQKDWLADSKTWHEFLVNDLAAPALAVIPKLAKVKTRFETLTKKQAFITGSGSAMFQIYPSIKSAQTILESLPEDIASRCAVASQNPW